MILKAPIFDQLPDRPTAHCGTICALPDGTLLSAWFGGSYETAPDVVILSSRLEPGATAWSEPQVIAEVPYHALGQNVFLPRPDGSLWLFFNVITDRDWTSAQPHMQRSWDNGRTWEPPVRLLDYPGLMFRSKPLVLPGRIILPAYDENTWQSRMLISDDDGASWRLTEPITTEAGNIHPCLVQRSDGSLLAYLRTGGKGGFIWRTESFDGGETWSIATPTGLPNPNSGIDLLRLRSGRLVLAFNNSATLRTPLCVMIGDEDERWSAMQVIEDERHEFSYPTLLQTEDELLHLVYTYRREHIHYARFTEDWLAQGQPAHELSKH
ncbi:MAG: sialidase family protein [Chloroflexota bacterium]|nr:MAG: hypothetical protein DIU68_11475 [Chloroflexota bacterium]